MNRWLRQRGGGLLAGAAPHRANRGHQQLGDSGRGWLHQVAASAIVEVDHHGHDDVAGGVGVACLGVLCDSASSDSAFLDSL
ncbi:MAG: hypothetical protein WA991_00515, partial [Ornithinimicrobium sp.]